MKNILENEFSLEEIAGLLTGPLGDYIPYNLRKILKYCEKQNIEPKDLSEEELKQFEI